MYAEELSDAGILDGQIRSSLRACETSDASTPGTRSPHKSRASGNAAACLLWLRSSIRLKHSTTNVNNSSALFQLYTSPHIQLVHQNSESFSELQNLHEAKSILINPQHNARVTSYIASSSSSPHKVGLFPSIFDKRTQETTPAIY